MVCFDLSSKVARSMTAAAVTVGNEACGLLARGKPEDGTKPICDSEEEDGGRDLTARVDRKPDSSSRWIVCSGKWNLRWPGLPKLKCDAHGHNCGSVEWEDNSKA
jgi:hypothetical protein